MKNKISKLAIIWENLEYGGMNTFLENLINSEEFRDIEIDLITNNNNDGVKSLSDNVKNKNFNLITYKSINTFKINNNLIKIFFWLFRPLLIIISFFQMYNILKNIKPNVILSASGGYGGFRTDSLSLIAAKILNIKVRILSIHHCYTKPIAWNFVLRMLDRLIIKSTSCLVFGSNAVKKDIKKNTILLEYFVKSKIIHHGVSLKRNTENKINLIKLFKTKNDVFKVGMLSRIEKNKGHFDLINAFNILPIDIKKKIKIFFIGPVDKIILREINIILKKLKLNKYFKITGFINCDSFKILKKLDLVLSLTNTFEGFGLSIAEALSVGKPIIATNVGAVNEFLNNKNSRLISSSNLFQIRDALIDFCKNHKEWKKKAYKGQKIMINKFSSKVTAKKYIELFNNQLKNLANK